MFLFDFMLKFMITIIMDIVRYIKFQEINTGMFIALDNSKEPKLILKNKLNEGQISLLKAGWKTIVNISISHLVKIQLLIKILKKIQEISIFKLKFLKTTLLKLDI
ncbi:hypothetical protein A0H76_843 [Hepatospora eriocheir]|uniref:Uncharacterized protein n=1 Tax=Hepatospora eriocheir TaxID=1081669 RepID=A0A1X0QIE9_9MICR|nr:hypothetical protein A0H76_843 [Hepatospora eriocheir]